MNHTYNQLAARTSLTIFCESPFANVIGNMIAKLETDDHCDWSIVFHPMESPDEVTLTCRDGNGHLAPGTPRFGHTRLQRRPYEVYESDPAATVVCETLGSISEFLTLVKQAFLAGR